MRGASRDSERGARCIRTACLSAGGARGRSCQGRARRSGDIHGELGRPRSCRKSRHRQVMRAGCGQAPSILVCRLAVGLALQWAWREATPFTRRTALGCNLHWRLKSRQFGRWSRGRADDESKVRRASSQSEISKSLLLAPGTRTEALAPAREPHSLRPPAPQPKVLHPQTVRRAVC